MLVSVSTQWVIESAIARSDAPLQAAWSKWVKESGPLTLTGDDRNANLPDELTRSIITVLKDYKDNIRERLEDTNLSEDDTLHLMNDIDRVEAILLSVEKDLKILICLKTTPFIL